MTSRRLLLLSPVLLGACSVLPDRPYVETLRFPLDPQRSGPPVSGRGRRSLLLRTLRAGAGLETRNLRVLRPDGTIEVDFYAEWAALPAEGAEQALRRWLLDARLFSAILAPGTRLTPDYVMEGELTTLIADQGRGEARAELTLLLIDERRGSQLVGQLVSQGTAPLPGGTAAPTPEQSAAAMSAALGNAFTSLERALVRVV